MDRRKLYTLIAEEVSKDPNLLVVVLEGLSQGAQSLAMQHRGVRGYAKTVRFLEQLDSMLQGAMDDANALVSEDR